VHYALQARPPRLWARLTSMPLSSTVDAMRPRSVLHRSLGANPGTSFYVAPEHVIVRELAVGAAAVHDPRQSPLQTGSCGAEADLASQSCRCTQRVKRPSDTAVQGL
jgi:hypothetical protein